MENKKKYISKDAALLKLRNFCAYQERCHDEVRSKLISLGIYGNDLENVIALLIEDNFLNEQRFAEAYVGGKFRIKQWGRIRLLQGLKQRHISEYCIKKAMLTIDDDQYLATLQQLLTHKKEELERASKERTEFECNQKIADHALRRGFETHLVWENIKLLFVRIKH